ncbi:MAG: glycosyl transferase group 1 [Firmicutes bacterium]|nr:glycosyl transferase group 1 [Bacillota bacterium]
MLQKDRKKRMDLLMNKETIIYFGGFELPNKNASAQRAASIAKSLRDIGYNVILYGLSRSLSETGGIMDCDVKIQGIEMKEWAYPASTKQWIRHLYSCDREIAILKNVQSIKMVICYNYPAVALWNLHRFCNANDIKFTVDVTEWYAPSKRKFPSNIIKDIDTYLRMKHVQPLIKNVICISTFLYNYYKKSATNCIIVPCTVDTTEKKWLNAVEYAPNNPITLGFAGDPGIKCDKERIDLLISVVCDLNAMDYPCRLKLAGFDQKEFEDNYPELLTKPFYHESIYYLGKLSHVECLKLISSVDYSVIVRENKCAAQAGLPTKLSESFACGTPVITTPTSNIADFIIEGENGFITKDFSYGSLLQTIREAYLNRDKLLDTHKFTRENNVLKYNMYTNVIEEFLNHTNFKKN